MLRDRARRQKGKTAEQNKRVADTLNYIALGRSLGSIAYNQYMSGGSKELAQRLA